LAQLPHLGNALLGYYGLSQHLPALALPAVRSALQALSQAAQAQLGLVQQTVASVQRMSELGFPPSPFFAGAHVSAPFDFMGDTLRGLRGVFLDVRRNPEKLLAAEEKVIPIQVETAVAVCRARHVPFAFLPLHRGSDGFISLPVFERFYWPQLKRVLLALIDADITPVVLWEGAWDQRLKYLAELPKGKTVGMFHKTNIFKAKEVLGDTMCIVGGMPVSMLLETSPAEIRNYTKRLCHFIGKGGGFIMSTDVGEMEGCDPELIKVWVDATKEFGGC